MVYTMAANYPGDHDLIPLDLGVFADFGKLCYAACSSSKTNFQVIRRNLPNHST